METTLVDNVSMIGACMLFSIMILMLYVSRVYVRMSVTFVGVESVRVNQLSNG